MMARLRNDIDDNNVVGETEWTKSGRYTGITDLELTNDGINQVLGTANVLFGSGKLINPSNLIRIFVSPRRRAQQTLDLLTGREINESIPNAIPEPITTDQLAEWDYGKYEGMLTHEIRSRRKEQGLDTERPWDIWKDGCEDGE